MKPGRVFLSKTGKLITASQHRTAMICASEADVSEVTAKGVLFKGWPVSTNARRRAYAWGVANRIFSREPRLQNGAQPPEPTQPTAEPATTDDSDDDPRALIKRAAALVPSHLEGEEAARAFDVALAEERAKQAERSRAAYEAIASDADEVP